jgi:hypothetical protein
MTSKSLFIAAFAFAATATVDSTSAHAIEFNALAATCVPGANALYNNTYFTTASGSVRQSGALGTGIADFYCAIPQETAAPSHVYLLYSSTENTTTTYVQAQYIRMHKTTGAITVIATASSRNGANNGLITFREQLFSASYDPANYAYYVRVDLRRRNTLQAVEFYQVTVW